MQGSNYQIDREPIMALPLINPPATIQKPLIDLVEKILSIAKSRNYFKNSAE